MRRGCGGGGGVGFDEVYENMDLAEAGDGLKDIDTGGFTSGAMAMIMDNADAAANFVGFIAFGDEPAAAGVSQLPEMDRMARRFLHSPLLRM